MKRFGLFLMIGVLATALHFVLMLALVHWAGVDPVMASAAGFTISALVNYQLNRVVTFASVKPHLATLPRFAIVAAGGLCINTASMQLLVNWSGLHFVTAQVVATALVLVWNFVLNKRWTFSKPE